MQTFARKLNLIALALGAALTAPGCATDWFSSSSSDYVAGELSQDVDNLPDPNAPPTPPKRSAIVSPLGAPFKESPDRLLLQANAYFEQGKFHDSSRLYQKYLATSEAATAPPTVLGQAHYRIAVVARKKLNFAEAKREFEIALRYEPQNQQYRFDLGKSAFDGADYATADAAFSALIAQNPNYPQAQYYYGLTLLEGTRRAEAIAPLTKAVGELEAAALLTDKYYALGETENAAAWESQTTQIAARLGRPVPAFPNKPAFASTAQPQNPTQSAPVVQTQNPTQSAPVAQTQNPAQSAPVAQTQGPAQVAPTTQTQDSAQVAPTTQTQDSVQVAPTTQTQGPAQVAPTTQTQGPAQVAPTTQTQDSVQVAPTTQTQGPAQVAPTTQTQGP
ncbi:MAG: tetratricopeptide repeat protein, partial [Thermoguttaceae bacterium]|nr:tetratricopeptide repeat protein [Thermoguttaceae bacterium]